MYMYIYRFYLGIHLHERTFADESSSAWVCDSSGDAEGRKEWRRVIKGERWMGVNGCLTSHPLLLPSSQGWKILSMFLFAFTGVVHEACVNSTLNVFRGLLTYWERYTEIWFSVTKCSVQYNHISSYIMLCVLRWNQWWRRTKQFMWRLHCFETAPLTGWTDLMQQVQMPPTGCLAETHSSNLEAYERFPCVHFINFKCISRAVCSSLPSPLSS